MSTLAVTQSDITAVSGGTISIDLPTQIRNYPHHFIGVEFFSDASGTPATPTGGTVKYQAKLVGSQNFLDTNNADHQASSVGVGDFAGNPTDVRTTLTSIVGATHARLTLSSNET